MPGDKIHIKVGAPEITRSKGRTIEYNIREKQAQESFHIRQQQIQRQALEKRINELLKEIELMNSHPHKFFNFSGDGVPSFSHYKSAKPRHPVNEGIRTGIAKTIGWIPFVGRISANLIKERHFTKPEYGALEGKFVQPGSPEWNAQLKVLEKIKKQKMEEIAKLRSQL